MSASYTLLRVKNQDLALWFVVFFIEFSVYCGYLQVNQKMMKSTLIKDLYGEIERLKTGERYLTLQR